MTSITPDQYRLKNGMRLVTVPMPGIKSLTVLTMVGVGSRFEQKSDDKKAAIYGRGLQVVCKR